MGYLPTFQGQRAFVPTTLYPASTAATLCTSRSRQASCFSPRFPVPSPPRSDKWHGNTWTRGVLSALSSTAWYRVMWNGAMPKIQLAQLHVCYLFRELLNFLKTCPVMNKVWSHFFCIGFRKRIVHDTNSTEHSLKSLSTNTRLALLQ